MTSNYRDFTSYVSTNSRANDYTPIQDYSAAGIDSVPPSSLLKLSIAPGSAKYFSTAPSFQARLDNYRIPPPARTMVSLNDEATATPSGTVMMATEGLRQVAGGDYASLGGAYKMNPN
jgi:hypothetical protein